jgi:succinoglycan biosynthesis transport protein ExoP
MQKDQQEKLALPPWAAAEPSSRFQNAAAQMPAGQGITNDREGGLAGYWAMIKRWKLLMVIGGVLGAIVAFVVLVLDQPVYQAGTTIEIQGFNEAFMGMAAVDPQAGTGAYATTPANINTQIRIIESFSIRGPVIDRLRRELAPVTPPVHGMLAPLRARLRGPDDPIVGMRTGLMMAAGTLKARAILNTRIIQITSDSTVPDIAANYENAVAAEYVAQNSQQRALTSQRTSQWLETQIEETRAKLEQAESKLQAFSRQSGITYAGKDEESLASSKLRELQGSLAGIQSDRIRAQARYEQLKSSPPDQLPAAVEDLAFREDESKLADLKQQLAQLSLTLTPAHYKVQKVQQQIADVTAAMERDKQTVLDRTRMEYEGALRREQLLTKAYQQQAGAVSSQADKASEYEVLKREADLYQQTLNMMLQNANQATVASAVPANNVRVIDAANPPSLPYRPNGITYETYGVAGGVAAGMALALLIEAIARWRRSITFGTPGYSARLLNVPELGVIPSLAAQRRLEGGPTGRRWLHLPSRAEKDGQQLVISTERPSLVAESFRLTLTSILLMSRRGMHPKVIVITSPGPGEGKTTVVSNIAIATAETGRRVLVIDADLRKPRIHSIFGVENTEGFVEAIARAKDSGNARTGLTMPAPTVIESSIPGVFIMAAGSNSGTRLSQTFHSPEIPALLSRLAGQFDVILIDTPPMLQFSDARLMARHAEGVILVVRSGVTGRESALAAREQLAQDQIEVLGTVLNDWDAKGSDASTFNAYYNAYLQYQQTAESE